MSIWDEPAIAKDDSPFVRFTEVDDEVSGTITALGISSFTEGDETKTHPKITLRTDGGEERIITAGQRDLKAKLKELRPEVGDHIRVVLIHIEGKKKIFKVWHRKAGESAAAAPAVAVASTNGVPPGTDPVAWAALPEAQKAAVRAAMGVAAPAPVTTSSNPPF